jgi:peptide/nickel transport system ATP-binding protein
MMTPVLEIENLRVEFPTARGAVTAVDGVSLALEPGERLGLIGESGSGKSTIALAVMRLIKPPGRIAEGRVALDGVDLLQLSEAEMRRYRLAKVALITQGAMNSLNPVIRIRAQMIDSLKAHGIELSKSGYQDYLAELLRSVGLDPDVANRFPHQLSGGMKQRVCIASAISLRPRVIIADEPTSALDVVVQRRVMETLRAVQNDLGCAVILIGHDMGLMAQFAQRVAVMRHGHILEENSVYEIFDRPQHAYTRLLMESLPSLDRRESYQDLVRLETVAAATVGAEP